MPTALIALGGNLGQVRETFRCAVELIGNLDQVEKVATSAVYRTEPVGVHAGEGFLNAALACETTLTAEVLLKNLQQIEDQLGRVRALHWGPRVIDLDLIALDQQIVESPWLTLPHPACWWRRFVLDPLVEIAAEWRHPVLKLTVRELRQRLLSRPLSVLLGGWNREFASKVQESIGDEVAIQASHTTTSHGKFIEIANDPDSRFRIFMPGISAANEAELVLQILRGALDQPVVSGNLNSER